MDFDSDRLWIAVEAEDPRFDGWVFCGVKTTGIYCRPSCPARTPKRENVRFFATAAAAQAAGFRACKRCRPDATPGSPDWDLRADLVGRAMRLIADGVVDREGVGGLAGRLGYTERHVHRQLVADGRRRAAGVGARAARADRAHPARDDGRADHGRGIRRRLSERAAVQRDGAGSVRADPARAAHARAARRSLAAEQRRAVAAAPLPVSAGRGRPDRVPRPARGARRRGGPRRGVPAQPAPAPRQRRRRAASGRRVRACPLLAARTCATWPRRCSARARCSTSTPTRSA